MISTTIKFLRFKLIVSTEMLRISRQEQAPALRTQRKFDVIFCDRGSVASTWLRGGVDPFRRDGGVGKV